MDVSRICVVCYRVQPITATENPDGAIFAPFRRTLPSNRAQTVGKFRERSQIQNNIWPVNNISVFPAAKRRLL
jgi:hypothetical protein